MTMTASTPMPLQPGDSAYDARRQVWNAMIDRAPALIYPCTDAGDVAHAIAAAGQTGLKVCVKGGGHNIAGTAVADGALMVDLSDMNRVTIDAENRLAHVEGGALWRDFDMAAQAHGLATPGGIVSSTGVAGLTLGGGFGWQARKHGLAIDNLLSAHIVLSDGQSVTASATQHADLFWALRGGGGNFGVVTSFTFRLHPLGPEVLFGPTFFALDDAKTVLTAYAKTASALPQDACVWANIMTAPPVPVLPESVHGQTVLTLMQSYIGTPSEGHAHLDPLYGGVTPLGSALAPRPFTEAQGFLDPAYDHGMRNYWRSHNHNAITPGLIDTLLDLAPDLPTPESELLICQLGGAVADVPADATAFPHRAVPFMSTPGVRWKDKADDARVTGWLKAASARIAEHAAPGAYSNFIAETDGPVRDSYGDNLTRLARIKQHYDPDNLFCFNQNVPPDTGTDSP